MRSCGKKKTFHFAMGPEWIESRSRDSPGPEQEAWVLDLALPKTQHLTLCKSFHLLNLRFLICKVSFIYLFSFILKASFQV